MPFRIRTRLSLLASLALLAATGCGEEDDVSPSFEDRIPLGLELEAADREVRFGDPAELSGKLTQGGDAVSDEVRLEEDPYPFDESWRAVATTTTDDEGRFSFEPELEFNTAYRAVAGESGEALSDRRVVFVDPVASVDSELVGSSSTRFVTTFRHSPDRTLNGAAVIQAETVGSIPFAAIERVIEVKPGLSRATVVLPGTPGDLAYEVCVSYAPSNAVGVPRAECGRGRTPFDG
jgi:hypothetical protein